MGLFLRLPEVEKIISAEIRSVEQLCHANQQYVDALQNCQQTHREMRDIFGQIREIFAEYHRNEPSRWQKLRNFFKKL